VNDERQIIEKIQRWIPAVSGRVSTGIGDDAAVLSAPAGKLLVTVDMLAEGVHFDRAYCEPADLGHKLLAVSLSDIASMAGTPLYCVISLALPTGTGEGFLEAFYGGLGQLARQCGVDVVGGNLTASRGGLVLDLCLLGQSGAPALRSGARAGDRLAVTGTLGASAIGLQALRRWGRGACDRFPDVCRAHLRPEPRVRFGQAVGGTATPISAMIDISDGLTSEAHHLAAQSNVGIQIREEAIPVAPATRAAAAALPADWLRAALDGGEDYELLFTFDPAQTAAIEAAARSTGTPVTVIGEVTGGGGVWWERAGGTREPLAPGGWTHQW
jgi:thiamine-monophosphate kinase